MVDLADLAEPDDAAHALGLADADALTESQSIRVGALLATVSRQFRLEAQREFSPGTTTARLLTVADRVRLPEPIASVTSVTMLDACNNTLTVDHTVDGQELILEYDGYRLWSGIAVSVTYTHSAPVPRDVTATVAAIVARHLTVDPVSAQAQSTELSTDSYRQRFAEWVSETTLLTDEECAQARSYRHPATAIIIAKP